MAHPHVLMEVENAIASTNEIIMPKRIRGHMWNDTNRDRLSNFTATKDTNKKKRRIGFVIYLL